jgi:hypothetical protein
MPGTAARGLDAVDNAIDAEAEAAFCFLERLIRACSTVGEEAQAQGIVAEELARLGPLRQPRPVARRSRGAERPHRPALRLPGGETLLVRGAPPDPRQ